MLFTREKVMFPQIRRAVEGYAVQETRGPKLFHFISGGNFTNPLALILHRSLVIFMVKRRPSGRESSFSASPPPLQMRRGEETTDSIHSCCIYFRIIKMCVCVCVCMCEESQAFVQRCRETNDNLFIRRKQDWENSAHVSLLMTFFRQS